MRGLVVLCIALVLAAFSGCVELVDEDPGLDAAAAEADRILAEHQEKLGHIAGTVTGSDGQALAGAVVDLVTVEVVVTDDQGRFTFLDLAPGAYAIVVSAGDHLDQKLSVDVLAGQFTRPDVTLEPVPAPEPYYTLTRFDGYSNLGVPFFGGLSCNCYFDGELQPEGLNEVLFEAEMGYASSPMASDEFTWNLDVYNEEESAYLGGYAMSPMRVSLLAEDLVEAPTQFYAYLAPYTGIMPSFSQSFTGYVTAFYNGPSPEGFSAFLLEEEEP